MNAATIVAFLAVIGTLIGVILQIRAKRRDDKLAAQLNRLDKQLSELYGPLYAWFESGHENFIAFTKVFPNSLSYDNEKYRIWMKQVFMRTNIAMEEIIINNAELFIGERIPDPFLKFCLHVAALKVYVAEWDNPEFNQEEWKRYMSEFQHPQSKLHAYIRASFEVLKEEQTRILSPVKYFSFPKRKVDERILKKEIERRSEKLKEILTEPSSHAAPDKLSDLT